MIIYLTHVVRVLQRGCYNTLLFLQVTLKAYTDTVYARYDAFHHLKDMVYYYAQFSVLLKISPRSLVEGKNMDRTSNVEGYSAIDFVDFD